MRIKRRIIVVIRFPDNSRHAFEFPTLRNAEQFAEEMREQGAEAIIGTTVAE